MDVGGLGAGHSWTFERGAKKNKYLLIMVDKLTKWIEAKRVASTKSGPIIEFISDVVHRYGIPHSIIMDNGSNFTS